MSLPTFESFCLITSQNNVHIRNSNIEAYATVWYSKSCIISQTQLQIGLKLRIYIMFLCANIYWTMIYLDHKMDLLCLFIYLFSASGSERLDSFSDSSEWQPYSPCFTSNGQHLILHEETMKLEDDCLICTCIKSNLTCDPDPDCDCIYKDTDKILKHDKTELTVDRCIYNLCQYGQILQKSRCEGSLSLSVSSASAGLLPCSYRGQIILHGDQLTIDVCTTCSCDNSTVKCDIKSCQPTFCPEPIQDPNECCDLCPYCKLLLYKPLLFLNIPGMDESTLCLVRSMIVVHSTNHYAKGTQLRLSE